MTAGTGSPGIRSFGSPAGTASLARQWAPGHQVPDCLARPAGIGSPGMTAGTGSSGTLSGSTAGHRVTRHQVIWLASGHWVTRPNRDRQAGSVHHAG
ncbi:unnamed protein product [Staurois parvus]|uniref:Uncharacterized protein n=1 Tax=Staurois parvus TaxID=386267 RepID=A0ABN9ARZ1_9NEOB|nr:unnamed protein product [Staurois parvus]